MNNILSDFGVQPVLLLAQVVNFVVLLFILKKLLYKPVLDMLQKRKEVIAQSLKNAEKIQEELDAIENRKQEVIDKAIEEGKKIIAESTAAGNQFYTDAQAKSKADTEAMMEQAVQMIAGEKEKMKSEVKSEVAGMIEMSLEKVLGKSLDSKSHQKITEESIKQIRS